MHAPKPITPDDPLPRAPKCRDSPPGLKALFPGFRDRIDFAALNNCSAALSMSTEIRPERHGKRRACQRPTPSTGARPCPEIKRWDSTQNLVATTLKSEAPQKLR